MDCGHRPANTRAPRPAFPHINRETPGRPQSAAHPAPPDEALFPHRGDARIEACAISQPAE
jgi:hypothetical protein